MIDTLDVRRERAYAFRAGMFVGALLVLMILGARAAFGI